MLQDLKEVRTILKANRRIPNNERRRDGEKRFSFIIGNSLVAFAGLGLAGAAEGG
jgi:hypothetical protein